MMPSIWHTVAHRHSIDRTGLLHKMRIMPTMKIKYLLCTISLW